MYVSKVIPLTNGILRAYCVNNEIRMLHSQVYREVFSLKSLTLFLLTIATEDYLEIYIRALA